MADENTYLNDVSTGLNNATEQKVGNENLAEIDYKDIIGKELTEGQKEQWLSKISQRIIKTIYTDASYNVKDNDIFSTKMKILSAVSCRLSTWKCLMQLQTVRGSK